MTKLLTRLTLLGAAGVVAVVAVYLIQVAVALIRANRNLASLVVDLEAARDNTRPLDNDLTTINSAAISLRDRLTGVDGHLQEIARLARG